jgi:hypothetical protein
MAIFTGRNPQMNLVGAIAPIRIGVSQPRTEFLQSKGLQAPPLLEVFALLDTVASRTVVSKRICEQLGLKVRNVILMTSASHENVPTPEYDIQILMDLARFHVGTIFVLGAELAGQSFQCLIGRDIMSLGIFIYNGVDDSYSFGI